VSQKRPIAAFLRPVGRLGPWAGALVLTMGLTHAPAEPDEVEDLDLEELNERAGEMEEEYEGQLPEYENAQERAEAAQEELEDVEERLGEARGRVAQFAASRYQGSGLDPTVELFISSDPADTLRDASVLGHMAESEGELVLDLADLQVEAEGAEEEAQEALEDAKAIIDDLEDRREEILDRIEELDREQAAEEEASADDEEDSGADEGGSGSGGGSGTVPESAKGWGFNNVTDRMAVVRDELIIEFGAPYPVGCHRPGDPGDHGTGRACDFMYSSGGAMPSSENLALGDTMAQYAIDNADRLGIKYVIWKQRIWDVRSSGGWSQMEDRGSITANHYDHLHVSVF
jgi:peptidoglycan DL-endopeptidase CwlO